jgi:transcriptional regulator with GAF, ATPase, and Fis domain
MAMLDDALTDLQQRIAALEREVDARTAERDEALAQQSATAEVLQVINSSPGDLRPVFDAILDKAHTLCGATRGTLFLFDGQTFRAAVTQGYPEDFANMLRQGISSSQTAFATLVAGARLVHIRDLTQLGDPVSRAVAERGGVRTNLLLPLRQDDTLLGVISCNRAEVRPFSENEIALLQNFAAQAVIAIEKCAAAHRAARPHPRSAGIARIPDRDERCSTGHQPVDLRPRTRPANRARHCNASLRKHAG